MPASPGHNMPGRGRRQRSVAIDFRTDRGRELVAELAAQVDVCCENLGPGRAARFGVSYAELSAANPRLIYLSVSGFGVGGDSPYAAWPAYGIVVEAMTGMYEYARLPGQAPIANPLGGIGDTGFAMELSGEVPGRIAEALGNPAVTEQVANGSSIEEIGAWAIHPGGKSIVDAVERGLGLSSEKVAASRGVLQDYGNMSSATVLFVLERLMPVRPRSGMALAFGPGLAMEGLRFGWTEGDAG